MKAIDVISLEKAGYHREVDKMLHQAQTEQTPSASMMSGMLEDARSGVNMFQDEEGDPNVPMGTHKFWTVEDTEHSVTTDVTAIMSTLAQVAEYWEEQPYDASENLRQMTLYFLQTGSIKDDNMQHVEAWKEMMRKVLQSELEVEVDQQSSRATVQVSNVQPIEGGKITATISVDVGNEDFEPADYDDSDMRYDRMVEERGY